MKKTLIQLFMAFVAALCVLPAAAHITQRDSLPDFEFAVRQIEQNYAGFPTLVTDANRAEYESLKKRLRGEILSGENTSYEAAGELFGWFGDFHLGAGIYSQPFQRPRITYSEIDYHPRPVACPVDAATYLIRIPTFDRDNIDPKWVVDAVESYKQSGCENLIVDIRGNGGGQDQTYISLLALLYDHPGSVDGVEIRVSDDNEAFIREAIKENGLDFMSSVVDSMAMRNTDFVALPGGGEPFEFEEVGLYPRRAAVIIDASVGSSGEQFVLDIRACSARTKIYGRDNTMGCLDFSNLRPVNMPYSGLTLLVPVTRSMRLPDRGIDLTGIAPDIRITLPLPEKLTDNIDKWVSWVAEDLKK